MQAYYQSDRVTIYCGDCRDVLPQLENGVADLAVTDPPYGTRSDLPWDPTGNKAEFRNLTDGVSALLSTIVKPSGSLYWFCYPSRAWEVETTIRDHWTPLNQLVWLKTGNGRWSGAQKEALRHYFPRSERILFCEQRGHQSDTSAKSSRLHGEIMRPIWGWFKEEKARIGIPTKAIEDGMAAKTGKRYMFASHAFRGSQFVFPTREQYEAAQEVFREWWKQHGEQGRKPLRRQYVPLCKDYEPLKKSYERLKREYDALRRPFFATKERMYTDVMESKSVRSYPGKHPCEKPLALLKNLIVISSWEGDTVIDPFAGSGSTGFAAIELGRKAILIEQDEAWCEKIAKKLRQHQS